MKPIKTRIKIFLTKHRKEARLDDTKLIKYEEDSHYYPNSKTINDGTTLYFKKSGGFPPSWYKNYLKQTDNDLKTLYVGGLFFHTIIIDDEEYKFAICFGGIDGILNLKYIESRFGLKIALNVADKLYRINKNRISDTQANVKESAVKGQAIGDFNFGLNTDLLNGVMVEPLENILTEGKITGSDYVSFTTLYHYDQLEELLKECIRLYKLDTYKIKYDFIDKIEEISSYDSITKHIHEKIIDIYLSEDVGNVWFAPSDTDDMDRIIDYSFYKNRITKNKRKNVTKYEIDLESVKNYMSEIEHTVVSINDFKKIKIEANYDDGRHEKTWNLLDCLYANVTYEGNQYVMNAGKIYKIDNNYYREFETKFNELSIFNSLPDSISLTEKDYNWEVYKNNKERYLHLDAKLTRDRNKIEICDLYDLYENAFIHIKHYGVAAKLSHVFAQAKVSAEAISNSEIKSKMIERLLEEKSSFELPDISDIKVVIGIITTKELEVSGHANLPFFSKVNAVSTLNYIKENLKFKEASMTYINKLV